VALLSGLERPVTGGDASVRRIGINTAAPIAARVIDAGFALVYLRLLGRTDVGAYEFVVVFTTYLDTLIDFGLNALVAREISRGSVSAATAFRAINGLRLGLWLVGLPVVLLVYGPLRETANVSSEAALAGWVFYIALLPTVLAKTSTGLLWAAERLELTAAVSVLATVLRISLGAVALFSGFGLVGLATASLLTNAVTSTVLWRLAATRAMKSLTGVADNVQESFLGSRTVRARTARTVDTEVSPQANTEASPPQRAPAAAVWLRDSWPLFVNQLLQSLFFKVDALLLPALAGNAAAGTYAAAYKVSEGAGIISSSFTLALFPRLSRETNLSYAYALALKLLLQVGIPLSAGIALLSEPVVAVVGGRDYLPDSATALAILICYLPLSYANGLTQYVLIAAGKQRVLTAAFAGALIFNVAANLLLIPRFSFIGAAWVTVASEVILLIPFWMVVSRVTHGVSLLQEARPPLLATALMAPVVWWLRDTIHPLAAIAAGAAVYPLALWALGGITQSQRRLLLQLLRSA
jgi:O-antigen/teichoic acid export membrane protein